MIYVLDLFGTFIFALTGSCAAGKNKMDPFGVLFLAFITAIGGGTVRDSILGRTPVFWTVDVNYIYLILIASIITSFFIKKIVNIETLVKFFDAIGLGVFTIIGINAALAMGISYIPALILGVIGAVMGGILRDVFSTQTPLIFSKEIYATACILGGGLYLLLDYFAVPYHISVIVSIALIVFLRSFAIVFKLSLPRLRVYDEDNPLW